MKVGQQVWLEIDRLTTGTTNKGCCPAIRASISNWINTQTQVDEFALPNI